MANTYTSPFGGTQQGQQVQNFQDVLRSITGGGGQVSPQIAQEGQQSALSTQLAMNQDQAPFMEQAEQSLTEQSGIPQLNQQNADLGKLFELYLADSDLASKYSNQSNTDPYAGGAQNPYLASADTLADSVTPTGDGFTIPGLVTKAMAAPVDATKNLMDLVNQAIGIQGGRVKSKMGDVSTSYQKSLDTLGTLATMFGDMYKEGQKVKEDATNRELQQLILDAMGGNKNDGSGNTGWERYMLAGDEKSAKQIAENAEKEFGEGEWGYQQSADGKSWEVLRPSTTSQETTSEPSQTVRMVNFETGDEVEVGEDDVYQWELQGYEEY